MHRYGDFIGVYSLLWTAVNAQRRLCVPHTAKTGVRVPLVRQENRQPLTLGNMRPDGWYISGRGAIDESSAKSCSWHGLLRHRRGGLNWGHLHVGL